MACMAMLLPLYGTMVIDGSDGHGHPGFPEHAGHHYSGHRVRDILHKETDKVHKGAQEVKKQHGLSVLFFMFISAAGSFQGSQGPLSYYGSNRPCS